MLGHLPHARQLGGRDLLRAQGRVRDVGHVVGVGRLEDRRRPESAPVERLEGHARARLVDQRHARLGLAAARLGPRPVAARHHRELVQGPPFLLKVDDGELPPGVLLDGQARRHRAVEQDVRPTLVQGAIAVFRAPGEEVRPAPVVEPRLQAGVVVARAQLEPIAGLARVGHGVRDGVQLVVVVHVVEGARGDVQPRRERAVPAQLDEVLLVADALVARAVDGAVGREGRAAPPVAAARHQRHVAAARLQEREGGALPVGAGLRPAPDRAAAQCDRVAHVDARQVQVLALGGVVPRRGQHVPIVADQPVAAVGAGASPGGDGLSRPPRAAAHVHARARHGAAVAGDDVDDAVEAVAAIEERRGTVDDLDALDQVHGQQHGPPDVDEVVPGLVERVAVEHDQDARVEVLEQEEPAAARQVVAAVAQRDVAHGGEVEDVGHRAEAEALDLLAADQGHRGRRLRGRFRVLRHALDGLALEVVLGVLEEIALLGGRGRRGADPHHHPGQNGVPTAASAHRAPPR